LRDRTSTAWVAAAAFVPVILTLYYGQMSSIVFIGVVGFWFFACQGKDYPAGMCLALTTIKPHVVYLLWIAVFWWVITQGRWKGLLGIFAPLLLSVSILALFWPRGLLGYQAVLANPPLHWPTPTLGCILRLLALGESPDVKYLPRALGSLQYLPAIL